MFDIEETLRTELYDVAGGLDVPKLPMLPEDRSRRHGLPVLAAAAVLVIVLGVVAVVASNRDDSAPQPAPPTPTSTPRESTTTEQPVVVSTGTPKIPFTLDQQLYSDGEQVPGTWWYMTVSGPTWLAMNVADDNNWYWGIGRERALIALTPDAPSVSPNGSYIASLGTEDGHGLVGAQDTRPPGRGLGNAPVDLGDPADGSAVHIKAVTNDAKVIVQGTETSMLWLPKDDNRTVDLNDTAPGVTFFWSTPAGLVVSAGDESEKYLAEISDDGKVTKIGDLPPLDSIAVAPGGEWMAWTPLGTHGGEVSAVGSLDAGSVDGGRTTTFTPPHGWSFKVETWAWEDDDNLVATVVEDSGAERMVRCNVQTESCVLIDAP